MTTKRIVFTQPNGNLSIVVPASEFMEQFDSEYAALVALQATAVPVDALNVHIVEASVIPESNPGDRYFRNSLTDVGGVITVDMPKARVIHMDRIRLVRNVELERESGSQFRQPPEIEAIFTPAHQAKLQELRDIPQTFDLERFPNPQSLKAAWPTELPARGPI